MGAPELLQHLQRRGVTLAPRDDGNLSVRPKGVLTDDERAQIRAHKPELIAYLRQQSQPPARIDWTQRARDYLAVVNLPPHLRELVGLSNNELYSMGARYRLAARHGLDMDATERLADDLLRRDRQGLDLHACVECRNLESSGRCAAARAGRLAGADRRFEPVKVELHRCLSFKAST